MSEPRTELVAAVSGSFHRHMEAITGAVHELATLSVRVLSGRSSCSRRSRGVFVCCERSGQIGPARARSPSGLHSSCGFSLAGLPGWVRRSVCVDGNWLCSRSRNPNLRAARTSGPHATRVCDCGPQPFRGCAEGGGQPSLQVPAGHFDRPACVNRRSSCRARATRRCSLA